MGGSAWAPQGRPVRLRASYNKPHGSRQFFACYSIGDDHLWGRIERAKGGAPTLRALKSIRARFDDDERVYVILDNLNHHRGKVIRAWCEDNNVELCFTPTYASWANPIEAHFGPLRQFVLAASDHADHQGDPVLPALAQRQHPRPRTSRGPTTATSPSPQ